jgi:hypothetical protein
VPRRIALRLGGLQASMVLVVMALVLVANVGSSGAEVRAPACPPPVTSTSTSVPPTTSGPAAGVQPAPEQTLACVGSVAITGGTYSHWLAIAAKALTPTKGHAPPATVLLDEVMPFLISSDWVQGEAADMGISVTPAEVKKNFDRIRATQFHKPREFRAFLRKSGQTVEDLLYRVELNMLSERIQKRVVAGHHGSASQERALSQFVKAFKAKWEPQTYCASEYDVKDCGHVEGSV